MKSKAFKSFMVAASAAIGVPLLGGCATTHDYNKETCVKVDAMGPSADLPPLIQWLIPAYNNTRQPMPCLHSQYFDKLVSVATLEANANNYHIQGAVIKAYEKVKVNSSKDGYARETLAFMDERLKARDLKIDHFYKAYDANKPTDLFQEKEENCWHAFVRENGQFYNQRVCGIQLGLK